MSAQEPGVMQCQDQGISSFQERQVPQIKVAPVEVMAMSEVGFLGCNVREVFGGRKIKILATGKDVYPPLGLPDSKGQHFAQSPYPADSSLQRRQATAD